MAGSQQLRTSAGVVDLGFVELCATLYGDAIDPADVWAYLYGDVSKMAPDSSSVSTKGGISGKRPRRGRFIANTAAAPVEASCAADGVGGIGKADTYEVVWSGEFSKTDDDKRQAFGWASVVEIDGKPVVDRQGDWIAPDELERAAYEYVLKSRKGGDQHQRNGEEPLHASDLIESFVVTPEKIEKMGLPADTPVGWWVGYKVHNDDTWQKIKKGHHTGFSIHGRGKRQEIPIDEFVGY